MLLSLAIIFLVGLSVAAIFERIGLPRIIGMLAVGILVSPYVLDLLDPKILGISSELRQIALIIILIKAGLSLNLSDLKKVGRPAVVDVRYTLSAGEMAVLMIFIALVFRAVDVCLCLLGTELNARERIFCVIAYLPKATVQAAIGSVPLSLGLPCGKIVLSVAVLAILITAPLGAIGIDRSYKICLRW